ncbi:MAG: exodeoxyribonuclease III [Desulfuromonas sp.]|nr:MAG: exodeoxyribonuclease III [Desulfuromonas sp.]
MKIVSFNINGIRARFHQLEALVAKHDPDIIGLQEIKVVDGDFPHEQLAGLGYRMIHHGQKGHYGVATFSKLEPDEIAKGFPGEDENHQRRLLITGYQLENGKRLRVVNGYFPQGENRDHPEKFPNKRIFYARLSDWLEQHADPNELLAVLGDMNISPEDADIGIGEDNRKRWLRTGKCSFLPEEREWLGKVKGWGLIDTYRAANPDVADCFSWFDYRSRGFEADPKRGLRIDLILATEPLVKCCSETGIDYELRGMEKPSDHCPIWAVFDI